MKSFYIFAFFFYFGSYAIAQPSQSETDSLATMSLEELLQLDVDVQIGNTSGNSLFMSPSTVTVITSLEIELYNYQTVSEAIQSVAGFDVYRTYLKRNIPTSRGILQDHYSNKVLLLIDGVPTWNAVTGESCLDRISMMDIDRIEILKGPASVLYGTNAYSGAINIVLKKREQNGSTFQMGYGMNDSWQTGVNTSIAKGNFKTFVSVNASDNIGHKRTFIDEKGVSGEISDHLKQQNVNLHTQYKSHSLLCNVFDVWESYYGVTPLYTSGAGNDQMVQGYLLNYSFDKQISNKFRIKVGAYYDFNHRDISRTKDNSIKAEITGNRKGAYLSANYKLNDNFSFDLGADYDYRFADDYRNYYTKNDSTQTDNQMDDSNLDEYSIFAQAQYTKNKFVLMFGNRITQNEKFGINYCPRATGVYAFDKNNSVKFIFGESYRAPALFEIYFYSPSTVIGVPYLKPEKSRSFELAYLTQFNNFYIQALVYHSIYYNKIQRSTDSTLVLPDNTLNTKKLNVYTNVNSFVADGIEIELKYANPRIISGFVNYNYILGNEGDKSTIENHYNFKYVPKHTISAGMYRTFFEKLTISTTYNFFDVMHSPVKTLGQHHLIDANILFKHKFLKIKMSHTLSCKNIFDTNFRIPEYTRRKTVNDIPYGTYRMILYSIKFDF